MARSSENKEILDFAIKLDNNEALNAVAKMSKGLSDLTRKKFSLGKDFSAANLKKVNKESTISLLGFNSILGSQFTLTFDCVELI